MSKTPPPRRRKSSILRRDENKPPVEILQQMGFKKHRAEKALAATGDRGVNLASDWLISHVNDPEIDVTTPRQYVLYLCPIGPLQEQLMRFYEDSLKTCGWNGAHAYFPHITLCPFFSVENSKSSVVKTALKSIEPLLLNTPGPLILDFFSQANFIGMFVEENYYSYLSELVSVFAKECKKYGIEVEQPKKQLHITLGYQYSAELHDKLNSLARKVDLNAECVWELRLYSRDPRIGRSEVRRVKQAYKASLEDELALIMGDFVFMDTNESTKSTDRWYQGTSWLTGLQGMFPGPFTERTAETWTWALHSSHILGPGDMGPRTPVTNGVGPAACGGQVDGEEDYEPAWKGPNRPSDKDKKENLDSLYAKVDKPLKGKEAAEVNVNLQRHLYVIRHGERMDFVFGRTFCDFIFDDKGNYTPTDMNMPRTLPKRKSENAWDYCKDAPLTCIGKFQAFMTGEALKRKGVVFHHVYASPSFRCVETATEILRNTGQNVVIRVEPGIFEWLGWYQFGLPKFFPPQELKAHGYNVDVSYKPFVPLDQYDMEEDILGYYKRSGETTKKILARHQQEGGNILIIGHAGSAEVCIRQLLGKVPRKREEFCDLCSKVPYCGMIVCQEDPKSRKWSVVDTPVMPFSHGHNKCVNVRQLLYPTS